MPRAKAALPNGSAALGIGVTTLYLSVIVLIPLAAVVWNAIGASDFWAVITNRTTVAALELTLGASLLVAAINAVVGTLIAWVLVRDRFIGKRFVNSIIDLPFALPTIVAGLTLLALYGPRGGIGINIAYTRAAVVAALLFVTLPFVVRSVQPVLEEVDKEMEEAGASLGASKITIYKRIILPSLLPAILSGVGLSFARAVGEFGSVVLISGNIPFKTEVAPVRVFGLIESGDPKGASAVALVLMVMSLGVLLLLSAVERWGRRHAR